MVCISIVIYTVNVSHCCAILIMRSSAILQDFEQFPEHRTNFFLLLRAVVQHCFQGNCEVFIATGSVLSSERARCEGLEEKDDRQRFGNCSSFSLCQSPTLYDFLCF